MSIKVTRKELQESYIIVNCGYCDSYNIRRYYAGDYYNSGVYGWNWTAYIINYNKGEKRFALVDGYRNHPISDFKNKKDYEIVRKYNKLLENIKDNNIIQLHIDEMMEELNQYRK